jgi:hypothetical protein
MKHIKLFESFNDFPNTKEEIVKICRKYRITNYTINGDMSIDVDDDIILCNYGLDKLPLKFNKVSGYFNCYNNILTTLEGAPKSVGGEYFNCSFNNLTTLEGGPKEVSGYFECSSNKLISLVGSPKEVGGNFYCRGNKLTTLKGSPEKVSSFNCDWNELLFTIEGSPRDLLNFHCQGTPIHSLYTLFNDYKWFKESIKEYSWLDGTEISKMRLCDVFLDLDLPEPDLSKIDEIYTVI